MNDFDFLAPQAALGIEALRRHFNAGKHGKAVFRLRPGFRADHANDQRAGFFFLFLGCWRYLWRGHPFGTFRFHCDRRLAAITGKPKKHGRRQDAATHPTSHDPSDPD